MSCHDRSHRESGWNGERRTPSTRNTPRPTDCSRKFWILALARTPLLPRHPSGCVRLCVGYYVTCVMPRRVLFPATSSPVFIVTRLLFTIPFFWLYWWYILLVYGLPSTHTIPCKWIWACGLSVNSLPCFIFWWPSKEGNCAGSCTQYASKTTEILDNWTASFSFRDHVECEM